MQRIVILFCMVLSFIAGGLVVYLALEPKVEPHPSAPSAGHVAQVHLTKPIASSFSSKPPLLVRSAVKLDSSVRQPLIIDPQDAPQILDALRSHFIDAPALITMKLDPQSLAWLLSSFGPKIRLSDTPIPIESQLPELQAELIAPAIGYWRVGHFRPKSIQKLVRAYNKWNAATPLQGMIIDLRYFQAINDYRGAADFIGLFTTPGAPLFALQGLQSSQEVFRSMRQPLVWNQVKPLIILVHHQTGGAGEVAAKVLAHQAHAILLGQPTRGEAALYYETPLRSGKFFRQAEAEAVAVSGEKILGNPVTPDVVLHVEALQENLAIQEGYTKGVEAVIAEPQLPVRASEASLVREEDVELEEALESKVEPSHQPQTATVRDIALQSAVDMVRAMALIRQPQASTIVQDNIMRDPRSQLR